METEIIDKEIIYALSPLAQKKETDEYCFNKCGKILVGGLIICDAPFLPCKEKNCPYMEKEIELTGEINNQTVVARKLKKWNGGKS